MEQKDELLKQKDEQLQSVQSTVKTELRSYCEAAKQGVSASSITAAQVKMAVKTAVSEEDRTRNIILFGMAEEQNENLEACATAVFEQVEEKPAIVDCHRIGRAREGVTRPVKVILASGDVAQRVVKNAGRLKRSEKFKEVYLSADRTIEERRARKELVVRLKEKRDSEPELHHFIRNGTIFSRKNQSIS